MNVFRAEGWELRIECEAHDVTPREEPDPEWRYTDRAGHVHTYDTEMEVPTATWVSQGPYWCDCHGDMVEDHVLECSECGEVISPGMRAVNEARSVPGLISAYGTVYRGEAAYDVLANAIYNDDVVSIRLGRFQIPSAKATDMDEDRIGFRALAPVLFTVSTPKEDELNIAGVGIGPGYPCRIVCELGTSHNGSLDTALRLIRECAEAGADFVKTQCYSLPEIMALRGYGLSPEPWASLGYKTLPDLYARAKTPRVWFPALVAECERVGVPWFSSVFGPDSLALLESLRCPAYKVSAWDEAHPLGLKVWEVAGRTGALLIASTRGTSRLSWADLTLFCPHGYPQGSDGCYSAGNWPSVFEHMDGLSYHGTQVAVPARAAIEGASMIEVHVQLDNEPSVLDAHSSLTVSQLRVLCEAAKGVRV
jgi:N-acetylneuraminate synthase